MWGRIPGQLPHWQSTVHVQPLSGVQAPLEAKAFWGEACLEYGQLVLFGDPALLAEIDAAVGQ
jgi:hypothetical protein